MATPAPPPVELDLTWQGERRFAGSAEGVEMVLDGNRKAGPSPVQALAFGLAGCMAIDVVHVLTTGRFAVEGLKAHLVGERASGTPGRLVRVDLHFVVTGDIPPDRVERAIALSREKYCSVWHSLRPDIDFRTSFEVWPLSTPAYPGGP